MNPTEGVAYMETAKLAPPVSVSTLALAGLPLSDWVIILTVIYTVLNLFFLLRDKWWRQRGRKD
jgi:hypothetical protein